MMYTDAYPSAVRATMLDRAAGLMRWICRRQTGRDSAGCARQLVERCVCPCLTEDDCIMEALVRGFVKEVSALGSAGAELNNEEYLLPATDESSLSDFAASPSPKITDSFLSNLRQRLQQAAAKGVPIPFGILLGSTPIPSTGLDASQRLGNALEILMREDAAQQRPFLATFVIDPRKGGLPAPAFFRIAAELGRFTGNAKDLDVWDYHAREFRSATVYWRPKGQVAGVATPPSTAGTPTA